MEELETFPEIARLMVARPASAYAGRVARGEVNREEPLVSVDSEEREPDAVAVLEHVCPECGRSFGTHHGLEVHRARAHKTKPKMPVKTRRSEPADGKALEDRMLELVVPSGLPHDYAALRAIIAWVEEGMRLRHS